MRKKLTEIIKDLQRCARQNEKDAKESEGARAVAGEQRRMIRILKAALK